jgi:hypothetical protein
MGNITTIYYTVNATIKKYGIDSYSDIYVEINRYPYKLTLKRKNENYSEIYSELKVGAIFTFKYYLGDIYTIKNIYPPDVYQIYDTVVDIIDIDGEIENCLFREILFKDNKKIRFVFDKENSEDINIGKTYRINYTDNIEFNKIITMDFINCDKIKKKEPLYY